MITNNIIHCKTYTNEEYIEELMKWKPKTTRQYWLNVFDSLYDKKNTDLNEQKRTLNNQDKKNNKSIHKNLNKQLKLKFSFSKKKKKYNNVKYIDPKSIYIETDYNKVMEDKEKRNLNSANNFSIGEYKYVKNTDLIYTNRPKQVNKIPQ